MQILWKLIKRDTLNLLMNPTWLFFVWCFPLLLVSILGFLTNDLYGNSFSSYDYYGVTLIVYSTLYAATFSANSFMEEKIKKANLRVVYTPIPVSYIPLAKILATFLFVTVFTTGAAGLLMLLFQITFGVNHLFQIWLLLAGLILLSSSVGVWLCTLFKSEGVANQILSIFINILAIFSGIFFPIYSFGETIVSISCWNPLNYVIQTVFALIYDQEASQFLIVFVILLCLSLVVIGCAQACFNQEDYL